MSDAQRNERRSRRYIDPRLQGRFIAAVVALEVVVVVAALVWLYGDLSQEVESQLYRVHHPLGSSVMPLLLGRLALALAVLVAANLAALAVAQALWARRVEEVAGSLRELAARTQRLDLRPDVVAGEPHQAVERLLALRRRERERYVAAGALLAGVDPTLDTPAAADTLRRAHALLLGDRTH
jgi:hypothetical protein